MELMTIHGSAKEEIKEQLRAVWDALRATREALRQACPNGRDYDTAEYPQVRKAHEEREAKVAALLKEIEAEVKKIDRR